MKIERISREDYKSYEFPLNESEIEAILEKLPSKDVEGLKKIIVTSPIKNEDFKRYGRYVPGGIIYLFAHQKKDDKFVIELNYGESVELTFEEFQNRGHQALLHELGHHVSMYHKGIKDIEKSEEFANNYQLENMAKYFYHLLK